MPKLNQRGIAHIFLMLFLLAGLVGGVYLVKQKTNILPKAYEPDSVAINSTPPNFNRVFVTSTKYDGNLGGLAGADAKCQERADVAGKGGIWKAWISANHSAEGRVWGRFVQSRYSYKLLNGVTIANNWSDLTDGRLNNPINITEFGNLLPDLVSLGVWTNTNISGGAIWDTPEGTCNFWTTNNISQMAYAGVLREASNYWTVSGQTSCELVAHLYCFEQLILPSPTPTSTPTPFPGPPGLRVSPDSVKVTVVAQGDRVKIFDITSNSGTICYTLPGYPTTYGTGININEVSGCVNQGEIRSVTIFAHYYVDPGIYTGEQVVRDQTNNKEIRVPIEATVLPRGSAEPTSTPTPTQTLNCSSSNLSCPSGYQCQLQNCPDTVTDCSGQCVVQSSRPTPISRPIKGI